MSDDPDRRPIAWRGPVLAWAILIVGVLLLSALGLVSGGELRWRLTGALALSAAMLATLAVGLVGLNREPSLIRLTAAAAALFIALMTLLSFSDLATRYHG